MKYVKLLRAQLCAVVRNGISDQTWRQVRYCRASPARAHFAFGRVETVARHRERFDVSISNACLQRRVQSNQYRKLSERAPRKLSGSQESDTASRCTCRRQRVDGDAQKYLQKPKVATSPQEPTSGTETVNNATCRNLTNYVRSEPKSPRHRAMIIGLATRIQMLEQCQKPTPRQVNNTLPVSKSQTRNKHAMPGMHGKQ